MPDLLITVAGMLPSLALHVVVLAVAVSRWNRHPMVSMLVAAGVVLRLMGFMISLVVPRLIADVGIERVRLIFVFTGLVETVGFGLVVAAVFAERSRA